MAPVAGNRGYTRHKRTLAPEKGRKRRLKYKGTLKAFGAPEKTETYSQSTKYDFSSQLSCNLNIMIGHKSEDLRQEGKVEPEDQ
ncbi:hypothetical protein [Pontibacter mangrovi]|uniref:Uncharacterized protein n=1 Tax=Pontibacter mangrovi TaxID=2589816 RepID=A0A501W7U8_9BACT|nr:hypothetical protein [Pontibacter mangrovi]TPE44782.1 hypothetical protein FJM65_07105 [Pontibacter mangrovi]